MNPSQSLNMNILSFPWTLESTVSFHSTVEVNCRSCPRTYDLKREVRNLSMLEKIFGPSQDVEGLVIGSLYNR